MSDLIQQIVKEHAKPKTAGIDLDKFKQSMNNSFAFEVFARSEVEHIQSSSQYQPIDMDFLKMRDKDGWPRFAVFTLAHDKSYFRGTYYHERRNLYKKNPSPADILISEHAQGGLSNIELFAANESYKSYKESKEFIEKYFLDTIYKLVMLGYKERGRTRKVVHTISQSFGSILPGKTREAIHQSIANRCFLKDNIMIICESNGWEVDKIVEMRPKVVIDPLVIGWNPKSSRGYIIDVFDLSPMEDYVKREFGLSEEKVED